ncbi:hypothetical protein [Tropicimonas sp. IMCC6043]|uniref:hypothetical protein n=1 Tax=Tropicimonas sp. IMCC6043 TaxID=2510645 RepID=UPI00101BBD8A|nr:hypothetical protein [Tropicimonas sp. IMCC6043]RYH06683.1 hypothetical protein EU800_22920 [Tropicimonas sp. IMCC6043]
MHKILGTWLNKPSKRKFLEAIHLSKDNVDMRHDRVSPGFGQVIDGINKTRSDIAQMNCKLEGATEAINSLSSLLVDFLDHGYPLPGKVFFLGFNKTGTSSIHKLFSSLGYRSFHHPEWREISKFPLFSAFDVFSDGEPQNIIDFKTNFPDAFYILNVRNLDAWVVSRLKHIEYEKKIEGRVIRDPYWDNTASAVGQWIKKRNEVHLRVIESFGNGNGNFMILNYTRDSDANRKLSRFLGVPALNKKKLHSNKLDDNEGTASWRELFETVADQLSIPQEERYFDILTPSLFPEGSDLSHYLYHSS